jgi:protein-histidine N-methyltransferase
MTYVEWIMLLKYALTPLLYIQLESCYANTWKLGCGTAIPSLVLFQYAITEGLTIYFTLTDYNVSVLQLVTLPNLLLTWASTLPATEAPFSPDSPNPLSGPEDNGDLDITPELTNAFTSALASQGITLNLISGSWSPALPFLSLIPTAPEMNVLVLASETIYSPTALPSFAEALIGILKEVRMGKGMIAAKKVYFGVGGSVDAFKIECRERKAVAYEIENHNVDLGKNGGIRRSLVEVQML